MGADLSNANVKEELLNDPEEYHFGKLRK